MFRLINSSAKETIDTQSEEIWNGIIYRIIRADTNIYKYTCICPHHGSETVRCYFCLRSLQFFEDTKITDASNMRFKNCCLPQRGDFPAILNVNMRFVILVNHGNVSHSYDLYCQINIPTIVNCKFVTEMYNCTIESNRGCVPILGSRDITSKEKDIKQILRICLYDVDICMYFLEKALISLEAIKSVLTDIRKNDGVLPSNTLYGNNDFLNNYQNLSPPYIYLPEIIYKMLNLNTYDYFCFEICGWIKNMTKGYIGEGKICDYMWRYYDKICYDEDKKIPKKFDFPCNLYGERFICWDEQLSVRVRGFCGDRQLSIRGMYWDQKLSIMGKFLHLL